VIEGGSSFSVEVGGIPKEVLYIGRRKIIHKKW